MTQTALEILSDRISSAHQRVQAEHSHINPVVGVNRQMRTQGIPADAITIDCLQSGKRLLIILHDQEPESVRYQFGQRDADPGLEFQLIALGELSEQLLVDWMVQYIHPDA